MRRLGVAASWLACLALWVSDCGGEGEPGSAGNAPLLFGLPDTSTGLDESRCRPERVVPGAEPFLAPAYGEQEIEALRSRILVDPPALLPASPYENPALVPADTGGVCAVLPEAGVPGGYRLATFPDRALAESSGGVVTHAGACGACSSLQDLAVYLAGPNLGGPVRECALLGLTQGDRVVQDCIAGLGFSEPCAQIWAYNSAHTRAACREVCLAALDDPNHLPDGSLNPCLACDEEQSGPVFKAVAGRTRRNSGVPSAICREPEEVEPLLHNAYP